MTTEALPAQVRGYLQEVRRHLEDLPPEDRADLTAAVEQRLADIAERPGSLADVERQFGAPAQLAADLRSAAGYPQAPTAHEGRRPLLTWLRKGLEHPAIAAVTAYVSSLRPAWWAVRGYLLLGGVLASLGSQKYGLHTIGYYNQVFVDATPPHWNTLWVAVPLLAVLASIVLGVLTPRLPPAVRLVIVGLDVLAVVALLAFPTWWLAPAGAYFAGLVN